MARAVAKYMSVALLALVTAQAAVPASQVRAEIGIVWLCTVEQQTPAAPPRVPAARRTPSKPFFTSRPKPQPELAARFQRPPPHLSDFA